MDADRTTSPPDPLCAAAPPHPVAVPASRRMHAQADRAVEDFLRGEYAAASDSNNPAASPPASVSLSAKAINLARRYRHATAGVNGGTVMPWPDIQYRLQAWHGIRTTVAELRAALDQK
jgi:hypothetical protein